MLSYHSMLYLYIIINIKCIINSQFNDTCINIAIKIVSQNSDVKSYMYIIISKLSI